MAHHLVVGAGGTGRATASALIARGHDVTVLTRSGTDLGIEGSRAVAGDAADQVLLTRLASGADSIVNAMNPPYTKWARDWPPVAAALLGAAEASGAGLVTMGNLYGYGPVTAPMTEQTPLRPQGAKGTVRAAMWADALAAHEAGRVRATELRASDYFGPGASPRTSFLNDYVIEPTIKGRSVRLITGVPDAIHSWTYLDDIGVLAATLATDDRSWGRPWHVPTTEPRSFRQVADEAASIVGRRPPLVAPLPAVVKRLARVVPVVRELDETAHQFQGPFVLDSTQATETFGLRPTPWAEALRTTIAALR
jgi:nucleoside-diphosphate-sugar epimerase